MATLTGEGRGHMPQGLHSHSLASMEWVATLSPMVWHPVLQSGWDEGPAWSRPCPMHPFSCW
eukprot:292791-Chlamydomonas_euryale.AAC.1